MLGLSLLVAACGMIEPPVPPLPEATITPPAVPHPTEGRTDCLVCHEKGIAGAPQYPSNHVGRPSDVCLTCHVPVSVTSGEISSAPMPTPPVETTPSEIPSVELYSSKCAACHGANREGVPGFAPALTPESLAARSDAETREAILKGISGTAMPAFEATLSPEEIDALLQLIKHTAP